MNRNEAEQFAKGLESALRQIKRYENQCDSNDAGILSIVIQSMVDPWRAGIEKNTSGSVWFDPAKSLPDTNKDVMIIYGMTCLGNYEGFRTLACIKSDKTWRITADLNGDEMPVDNDHTVWAWTYIPDSPFTDPNTDPDEPILMSDGSVLDPVTYEVVNHMPRANP